MLLTKISIARKKKQFQYKPVKNINYLVLLIKAMKISNLKSVPDGNAPSNLAQRATRLELF